MSAFPKWLFPDVMASLGWKPSPPPLHPIPDSQSSVHTAWRTLSRNLNWWPRWLLLMEAPWPVSSVYSLFRFQCDGCSGISDPRWSKKCHWFFVGSEYFCCCCCCKDGMIASKPSTFTFWCLNSSSNESPGSRGSIVGARDSVREG